MTSITEKFISDAERVVYERAEAQLTDTERNELNSFFNGCQTATTTAKGVTGAAIAVWMAYASRKLQQRRICVKPLYPMAAGVGIALVVFQALTPAIYDNEKKRLALTASPAVIETVESLEPIIGGGANAFQVAKLFQDPQKVPKGPN